MAAIESFAPKMEEIQRLNNWLFDIVEPYIVGRVFETHSGKGEFSSLLIDHGHKVQLNAISDTNREFLRQKFEGNPLVRGIHKIDFSLPDMEEEYLHFEKQFPTILAFSDFEADVTYDLRALQKAKRLLTDGGRMVVVGQCITTAFPGSEPDIEQLRQYNYHWISNIFSNCTILKARFFDWNGACFVSVAERR